MAGSKYIKKKRVFPWAPLAVCALLFVFLNTQAIGSEYDIQLRFTLGVVVIFIMSFIKASNRKLLFENITPIFLLLFAQCLLFFAGLFYSSYPKFALQQFFLNLGGLFIFATMYVYFLRGEKNIRVFLTLLSACVALASLINIEMATSRHLFGVFQGIAKLSGASLDAYFASFETNTRVTTVLGNPNVFAPIAVFGMYASLCCCGKAGSQNRRDALLMGLAIICGTNFILCFSLGTILAYIPTLICLIFVTIKENRRSVFFSNFFCLLISLILAFIVFALRSKGILPLLAVLLLSCGAGFVYIYLRPIRLPKIAVANKTVKIVGVLLVCVVLLACAVLIDGPYELSAGGTFRRAVALESGEYAVEVELEDPASQVTVDIYSMSYTEAALKENTAIRRVVLRACEPAEFAVPEGAAAVFFRFSAGADVRIESAKISGSGVEKQLKLRYMMLPEFVVNRLQGLWVNDNAIQRFIFFRDGIRLGMTSPIFGLGGGAFEGGLFGVADYKYETKHTHNEYIQNFIDGGIVGLFLFIALTIFVFRALFIAGKSQKSPSLLPFLSASMLLIFLHAMIEIDFSIPAYKLIVSALFALTAAECGDVIDGGKKLKSTVKSAFALTFAVTLVLAAGRTYAINLVSSKLNLESLQRAAVYDPFNGNDYKISFLINTANDTSESISSQRQKYLASLEKKKLDSDAQYLLSYYYLFNYKPDVEKGVMMAEAYIRQERVNPEAWDNIIVLYEMALENYDERADETKKITESFGRLHSYLTELNQTLPKAVVPELVNDLSYYASKLSEGSNSES